MTKRMDRRASAAVAACFFAAPILASPSAQAEPSSHPELRYDLNLGITVVAVSLIAHGTSEFALKSALGPKACAWCDRDGEHDALNALDRNVRNALRWEDTETASALSYATAILAPIAGTVMNGIAARSEGESWETVGVDALIVAEVITVSMATNQFVKFVVARERPFVHARSPDERRARFNTDDNLSFYSGHTKLAFSAATAAGMVASMRHYDLAPAVWASGGVLASSTGVLRIGADRHYFSDVFVGALLGIAYGTLIPYVFHRPTRDSRPPPVAGPTTTMTTTSPRLAFSIALPF